MLRCDVYGYQDLYSDEIFASTSSCVILVVIVHCCVYFLRLLDVPVVCVFLSDVGSVVQNLRPQRDSHRRCTRRHRVLLLLHRLMGECVTTNTAETHVYRQNTTDETISEHNQINKPGSNAVTLRFFSSDKAENMNITLLHLC